MALKCKLEKSILKKDSCEYTLNSVKEVYLASIDDVTKITRETPSGMTGTTDCGVEVSEITLGDGAKWAKIMPSTNSANFQDNLMTIDAGGKYRHQILNFSINGAFDAQMQCNLDNLSLGEYVAIVRLASGNYILLGDEAVGLTATACNNTGAGSATEFSGIQVTMEADVTVSAAPLSEKAITALKQAIAE